MGKNINIFSLNKKIALITGSSRGLGLVMAKGLGHSGATIILNGRHQNEERLNQVVGELKKEGIKNNSEEFSQTHTYQHTNNKRLPALSE